MTQHDLRERIGYVPQKGVLFSGTIDSNIRYGKPDMSSEDVKLAAEISQSDDFILRAELTYQVVRNSVCLLQEPLRKNRRF